jgi:hypothetical protein
MVKAMKEEVNTLEQNQTYNIMSKPVNVKPISCKLVYKIRRQEDRSIERYKACLVARGFS